MAKSPNVLYASEPSLRVDEFRELLRGSGLAAHRPVDDLDRLGAMLAGANVLISARLDGPGAPLLGVIRAITDHSWCCYVSELAVSRSAQGLGIGKGLLEETRRQLGPLVSVILASVPEAVGFYERIGMPRLLDAFWYQRDS